MSDGLATLPSDASMLLITSLIPLILLSTGIAGGTTVIRDSHISLSISRHLNHNGNLGIIQRDRKRLDNLVSGGKHSSSTLDETHNLLKYNTGIVYSASVGIGDPPTYYNLILDTGSANTWVGANKEYQVTSSSVKTGNFLHVEYGKAYFEGYEYNDSVTIASGIAISQQSIGVASDSDGIYPYDGILGIGPRNLSVGTLWPDNSSAIPTVKDNLYQEGKISQNLVALYFEPTNSTSAAHGEVVFGSTDSSKYTGNITYLPITETVPADGYWGVDASFRYGGSTVILDTTAGILDTGNSLIYIATDAYNRYVDAIGAVIDQDTGLLGITSAQYTNLQSLFFVVGGSTYELTANAQIWPRTLNNVVGGKSDSIFLVLQDIGQTSQPGIDFICGMTFLERFYTVYDTGNSRLGLATTQFTNAISN